MARPWGLLPAEVKELVLMKEWRNIAALKSRLLNQKPFPIRIGLKPPTGHSAIEDMAHYQKFISQWRAYAPQRFVEWDSRNYRKLSTQTVPKLFILSNIRELIEFVGDEAVMRSHVWTANMSPLLEIYPDTYSALVRHLSTVELMRPADSRLLANLIGQLTPGMGEGKYLRALPLVGVDTKFLENYPALIADILDIVHDRAVTNTGGLLEWLGCHANPRGWLTVRPLCESTKSKMAGLPVLQLSGEVLKQQPLPAGNILVVENMESGLGLPALQDTIAVFGGGKNVAWMDATWLKSRRVAYWGDIDTWGLSILSDVRSRLPNVEVLMMDEETLDLHKERMVGERKSVDGVPEFLTDSEIRIFSSLKNIDRLASRLEQERLSTDYIQSRLRAWLAVG
ncbi:MAG: DUF2220 family protein [Methylococcales bacterium]|nr:DUF2220 family protein [Methylococcales bacterium]